MELPQRLWARRLTLTSGLAEEPSLLDDLFPSAQEQDNGSTKNCCSPSESCECQNETIDNQELQKPRELVEPSTQEPLPLFLDGSTLGDIPARYVVPALQAHEFPVIGVWVDPRVVPGFRYRVRPLTEQVHLFGGHALTLQSIGRGYARRLTFEATHGCLNDNTNYLWSDSRPEGLAFELEVVSSGDKFTLHDVNHVAAGTLEVLHNQTPQEEVNHTVLHDGCVQKKVRLSVLCKVEWFENGQSTIVIPVSGLAVVVRTKSGKNASVTRVLNACVGSHQRRGFTLTPGVSDKWRRTTVHGEMIGDVPTRYTITGLEAHEMPVVGTYVDPRIAPGFYYRVRPAGSRRPLFSGRALRLVSVGPGYGKRITFTPDPMTLNSPKNFLWSDSHPDGLGFEPRAVHAGMKFAIMAGGERLGEASVFRADAVQQEERQEVEKRQNGCSLVKYIHIDVTCHVTLDCAHEERALDPQAMRVSGTAVVARSPGQSNAHLLRVENVGLDSQLNMVFVTQQAQLEFWPL